jgi:hypothetical protein
MASVRICDVVATKALVHLVLFLKYAVVEVFVWEVNRGHGNTKYFYCIKGTVQFHVSLK